MAHSRTGVCTVVRPPTERGDCLRLKDFNVTTRDIDGDARVVSIYGELDLWRAPELQSELLDAIDDPTSGIVVDLTGTTFIDSTVVGVLLDVRKRLLRDGRRLALVCVDRNLVKLFEITGLDRIFRIVPSVAEAADDFRTRVPAASV